ncbi:hypothetical protein K490DRAFT_67073 [Saccharata proteae CBS 121410]|uniref:Uncharacterized protein n=1 Tax=Saccharata proteae CBS 121410 TaxID=1314787 RepID=A0A9P4HUI1_9PEZI|nr:hypothetical protein K490DRAFT_67073 [Saccharata proteae CBS 121410]
MSNACRLTDGTGPVSIERDTAIATDASVSDAIMRSSLSPHRDHGCEQASRDPSITGDRDLNLPAQSCAAEKRYIHASGTDEGDINTADLIADGLAPIATTGLETSSSLANHMSTQTSARESADSLTGDAVRPRESPQYCDSEQNLAHTGDTSNAVCGAVVTGVVRNAAAIEPKLAQNKRIRGSDYPDTLRNMIARALLDAEKEGQTSLTVQQICAYCRDSLGYSDPNKKLMKSLNAILGNCHEESFAVAFRLDNVPSYRFTKGAADEFNKKLKPLTLMAAQSANSGFHSKPQTKGDVHKARTALPKSSGQSTHPRPGNSLSAPGANFRSRSNLNPTKDPVYEHMFVRQHRVFHEGNRIEIVPGYKNQPGKKWDQLTRLESMTVGQTDYNRGDFAKLPLPSKFHYPEFPAVPRIDTIARVVCIAKRDDIQGEAVLVNWYLTKEAAEKWHCTYLQQWDDTDMEDEYVRSDIHDVVSPNAFIERINPIKAARRINCLQHVKLTVKNLSRRLSLKTQEPAEVYSLFVSLFQQKLTKHHDLQWYWDQDNETRSATRKALFSKIESGVKAAQEVGKEVETSFSERLIGFFQAVLRTEVKKGDQTAVKDAGQYTRRVKALLGDPTSDQARRRASSQYEMDEPDQNSMDFTNTETTDNERVYREVSRDRSRQVQENMTPVVALNRDYDPNGSSTADSHETGPMSTSELTIHNSLLEDLKKQDFAITEPFSVIPEYDPSYFSGLSEKRESISKRPKAKGTSKNRLAHARQFRDPDNIHKEVDRPLPTAYKIAYVGSSSDWEMAAGDSSLLPGQEEDSPFSTVHQLLDIPENARPTKYGQVLAFRDLVMVGYDDP